MKKLIVSLCLFILIILLCGQVIYSSYNPEARARCWQRCANQHDLCIERDPYNTPQCDEELRNCTARCDQLYG